MQNPRFVFLKQTGVFYFDKGKYIDFLVSFQGYGKSQLFKTLKKTGETLIYRFRIFYFPAG